MGHPFIKRPNKKIRDDYYLFYNFSISEMVTAMKAVASMDVELTVEERNLLSVAYKNVIGARRASWRIISSIEQKEENKASEDKLKMIKTYRNQVIMTYHFFNTFCQKGHDSCQLRRNIVTQRNISKFK